MNLTNGFRPTDTPHLKNFVRQFFFQVLKGFWFFKSFDVTNLPYFLATCLRYSENISKQLFPKRVSVSANSSEKQSTPLTIKMSQSS